VSAGSSVPPPALPLSFALSYVVPVKAATPFVDDDFTQYLTWLSTVMPVIVVDGSQPSVFEAHDAQWGAAVRHIGVESTSLNGKVAGVCDGVAAARTPHVIVADDDVRYDGKAIESIAALLTRHDVVIPQNYFSPPRWHTHWDTGRTLVNRALSGDYAGTIALRRDVLMSTGGYCGAVLFENLELTRTVTAHGFKVHRALDVFVARRPPDFEHFAGQRVRQAYDSLAQPARLGAELGLLPLLVVGTARSKAFPLVAIAAVMAVGEFGRRRGGGRLVFQPLASAWVPLWVVERALCAWVAVGCFLRGGVTYGGRRLRLAAHRPGKLRAASCPSATCSCDIALRHRQRCEA